MSLKYTIRSFFCKPDFHFSGPGGVQKIDGPAAGIRCRILAFYRAHRVGVGAVSVSL